MTDVRYYNEILAGLLFGGAIAGALYWDVSNKEFQANRDGAAAQVQAHRSLLEGKKRRQGKYPTTYSLPEDPWGRTYVYSLRDSGAEVCSHGPDGRPGTGDDICSK